MSLFRAMLSRCGLRRLSMAPWLSVWITMFVSGLLLASRIASRMAASSVCTVEQPSDALNDFVMCGDVKAYPHVPSLLTEPSV